MPMEWTPAYGRIEKRNCTVVSYGSIMEKMFKKKLVGLKSVVRIKSERTIVAIAILAVLLCFAG